MFATFSSSKTRKAPAATIVPSEGGSGRRADEDGRGHEERAVGRAARDRPCQEHLERAALPLAGHRGGREADREDARERDRDGMDDAQGDRPGQAEDVAAAERP